jgi:hypothetical protein
VKVLNGAVFGIGIYTDTNPNVPLNYGARGNDLFVCIGREDPQSSAYKVFKSSQDVAPVLHIRFDRSHVNGLNFDGNNLVRLPSLSPHVR